MKNKNPRNNKDQYHGLWIYYLSNGKLCYKGQFINNIRHGYWIRHWTLNDKKITFYLK